MPFAKVVYGSSYNISIKGTDYFEVLPGQMDENGEVPPDLIDGIWQEAVNDYMSDTYIEIVESEDE